MSVRKLVLLGLAIAIYVHCRAGGDEAKPATTVPAPRARPPDRFTRTRTAPISVMLRAAMARVHKIDITVGELRLEGKAVDEQEQPIAGATITLDHQRTVIAGADGSFAFDDLSAGDYELTAENGPAYGEDSYSLTEHSDPEAITLRVGPTLVLHVADHAGTPVLGAKVSPRNHLDTYTDRDGKVTIRGMELRQRQADHRRAGLCDGASRSTWATILASRSTRSSCCNRARRSAAWSWTRTTSPSLARVSACRRRRTTGRTRPTRTTTARGDWMASAPAS